MANVDRQTLSDRDQRAVRRSELRQEIRKVVTVYEERMLAVSSVRLEHPEADFFARDCTIGRRRD